MHRVIGWIESNCRHLDSAKDKAGKSLAGQPVKLLNFHKEIIRELFSPSGELKKRYFFIQSKRKISKTNLIAWILAYYFLEVGETESGMTLPVVSGRHTQTKEVFKIIYDTIFSACRDKKNFEFRKERITNKKNSNRILVCSSNPGALYSLNPGPIALYEEIQTWAERTAGDLVNSISNAMGNRPKTLEIFACNPGRDFSNEFYKDWLKHFRAHSNHPDYLVTIYEAPRDCDILDKKAWLAADPALREGAINSFENIRAKAELAQNSIALEDDFRRDQLGITLMRNLLAFVDVRKFQILRSAPKEKLPISLGCDLSIHTDLSSLCIAQKLPDDRGFYFRWRSYLPEGGLEKFHAKKRKKALEYERRGELTIQRGEDVINADLILKDIETEIKQASSCEGFFYDYNSGGSALGKKVNALTPSKGMFSTGRTLTEPIQNLQRLAEGKMFFCSDNQLARDHFNNTLLKTSKASKNFKLLDRVNSAESIDSVFSALYAISPWLLKEKTNWENYV